MASARFSSAEDKTVNTFGDRTGTTAPLTAGQSGDSATRGETMVAETAYVKSILKPPSQISEDGLIMLVIRLCS